MDIQPAYGGRDLNPQQVEINQSLCLTLGSIYNLWGYEQVSPPIIERVETLIAKGAISTKEIVNIVADEPHGLRPEMTTSIVRTANTRLAKKKRPLRLWANGTVFKNLKESDGSHSIEETLQSGVELIGKEGMLIEVELLNLLLEALKGLDLPSSSNPRLLIGHTSLMNLILSSTTFEDKEYIKDCLNNFNLIDLENFNISKQEMELLRRVQRSRGEPSFVLKELVSIYGSNKTIDELDLLFSIVEPIGKKHGIKLQLDPTFEPHYDLYTGLVFQLVCDGISSPCVIASGGRYDGLIKMFTKSDNSSIGAGFAFSIDNIREITSKGSIKKKRKERVLIAFAPSKKYEDALTRQRTLHQNGFIAVIENSPFQNRSEANKMVIERAFDKLDWIE